MFTNKIITLYDKEKTKNRSNSFDKKIDENTKKIEEIENKKNLLLLLTNDYNKEFIDSNWTLLTESYLAYLMKYKGEIIDIPFFHKVGINKSLLFLNKLNQYQLNNIDTTNELLLLCYNNNLKLNDKFMENIFIPHRHEIYNIDEDLTVDYLVLPINYFFDDVKYLIYNKNKYYRIIENNYNRIIENKNIVNEKDLNSYLEEFYSKVKLFFVTLGRNLGEYLLYSFFKGKSNEYNEAFIIYIKSSYFYHSFLYYYLKNLEIVLNKEYFLKLFKLHIQTYCHIDNIDGYNLIKKEHKSNTFYDDNLRTWGEILFPIAFGYDVEKAKRRIDSQFTNIPIQKLYEMYENDSSFVDVSRMDVIGILLNNPKLPETKKYLEYFIYDEN